MSQDPLHLFPLIILSLQSFSLLLSSNCVTSPALLSLSLLFIPWLGEWLHIYGMRNTWI